MAKIKAIILIAAFASAVYFGGGFLLENMTDSSVSLIEYSVYTNETSETDEFQKLDITNQTMINDINPSQRDGYIFGGWYVDDEFNTPYPDDRIIIPNTKLYGKWSLDYEYRINAAFEEIKDNNNLGYIIENNGVVFDIIRQSNNNILVESEDIKFFYDDSLEILFEFIGGWSLHTNGADEESLEEYLFSLSKEDIEIYNSASNINNNQWIIDINGSLSDQFVEIKYLDDIHSKNNVNIDNYVPQIGENIIIDIDIEYETNINFRIIDFSLVQLEYEILIKNANILSQTVVYDENLDIISSTDFIVIEELDEQSFKMEYSAFEYDKISETPLPDGDFVYVNFNYNIPELGVEQISHLHSSSINTNNRTVNNKINDFIEINDEYAFVGWYFDEEFNDPVNSDYILISNITIYAMWDNVYNQLLIEQLMSIKNSSTLAYTTDAGPETAFISMFNNNDILIEIPGKKHFIDYDNKVIFDYYDDEWSIEAKNNYLCNYYLYILTLEFHKIIHDSIDSEVQMIENDILEYTFQGDLSNEYIKEFYKGRHGAVSPARVNDLDLTEGRHYIKTAEFINDAGLSGDFKIKITEEELSFIELNFSGIDIQIDERSVLIDEDGDIIENISNGINVESLDDISIIYNDIRANQTLVAEAPDINAVNITYNFLNDDIDNITYWHLEGNNLLDTYTVAKNIIDEYINQNSSYSYIGWYEETNLLSKLESYKIVSDDLSIYTKLFISESVGDFIIVGNTIIEYIGTSQDVVIPSVHNGVAITEIAQNAFSNKAIASVMFPENLITIGENAFSNNNIKVLSFPNTLRTINDYAFANNRLARLELPNSVEILGEYAFNHNALTYLRISDRIEVIPSYAFNNNLLVDLYFPESVKEIGDYAFSSNFILDINLSINTEKIGDYAFSWNNIGQLIIPSTVTEIGSHAFTNNNISLLTLPDSIETLSNYVFANNQISELFVPNSVKFIGSNAFRSNSISNIHLSKNTASIGSHAFANNNINTLNLPETIEIIYSNAFRSNNITDVVIPPLVTSIGNSTFRYNNIQNVTLHENITSIGSYAFSNNQIALLDLPSNLESINNDAFSSNRIEDLVIPQSVTSIGRYAFNGNLLKSVVLSNNMTTLSTRVFSNNLIENLIIPNSITSIHTRAFYNNNISQLHLSSSLENIGNEAFMINSIIDLIIPDSVTEIGESAFANNNLLTLTLSENLSLIREGSFYDNKIENLVIPDSVLKIEDYAFYDNSIIVLQLSTNLTEIGKESFMYNNISSLTIPSLVSSIDEFAFYSNEIIILQLPLSLSSIGESAFMYNDIINLTLPNSVTNIGINAFSDNDIATLNLPDNITKIDEAVFQNNKIESLVIPNSVIDIGKYAFSNNCITNLTLPNNISKIEEGVFYQNKIEELEIPDSVLSIKKFAFYSNKIHSIELSTSLNEIGEEAFSKNALETINIHENINNIGENAFSDNPDLLEVNVHGNHARFNQSWEYYGFLEGAVQLI